MMSGVAVVTDALSGEHFLPIWAEYYGRHFGRENLHVFSYDDALDAGRLGIGHVMRMKVDYHDGVRAWLFNDFLTKLLPQYDCVIRTDVDEFLVPDPALHDGLGDFVAAARGAYVTAVGLDVVQMPDEPALDFHAAPRLAQRKFAVKVSAYSKTCMVRRPVQWGLGFHTCEALPAFGDLYLFHMKFADAGRRLEWLDFMAEACRSDAGQHEHFRTAGREFQSTLRRFQGLPKASGGAAIRDRAFVARLEGAVRRRQDGQFDFHGVPTTDDVLTEIPPEFAQQF